MEMQAADELIEAVKRSDLKAAEKLIKEKDSTLDDSSKLKALMKSVRMGNVDLVKLFLGNNIDANALTGVTMNTPLHYAAYNEDSRDVAMLLLKSNAVVDKRNSEGRTALHLAAYHNSGDMIALLLNHGSDPNLRDNYGNTPFHYNFHYLAEDATSCMFLRHGADVKLKNEKGRNALHLAAKSRSFRFVEFLLRNNALDVNERDGENYSPLHMALRNESDEDENSFRIVKLLMIRGAVLNGHDEIGGKIPVQRLAEAISIGEALDREIDDELAVTTITQVSENHPVTYFDLLSTGVDALSRILRCAKVRDCLQSGEYRDKFFYLSFRIEEKFRRGMKRVDSLDKTTEILRDALETVLPQEIIIMLSYYFKDGDLKT